MYWVLGRHLLFGPWIFIVGVMPRLPGWHVSVEARCSSRRLYSMCCRYIPDWHWHADQPDLYQMCTRLVSVRARNDAYFNMLGLRYWVLLS